MTNFLQDLIYGFRLLLKKPGFTAVAALSLALGIGANTVVFSLINGLLLREFGYQDPDRIVFVFTHPKDRPENQGGIYGTDFFALREQMQSFSAIGGQWGGLNQSVGADAMGAAERISGQTVTPGFFTVLGVPPLMGRPFNEEEAQVNNQAKVMVISEGYWRRRFAAAPDILGRSLRLDGEPYTIIGVMPGGFEFFSTDTDYWLPAPLTTSMLESPAQGLQTIARLKPGVTIEQAQAEMTAYAAQRAIADPGRNKDRTNTVMTLQQGAYGSLSGALFLLQGSVAFVLLIGCANVAGLLLARAASRRTEIAVRTAIGASRMRVVRQLITESIPLAALGGVAGIGVAWVGLRLFVAYSPTGFLPLDEFTLDGRTLGFAALVSLATALVFGIVPALQTSKADLSSSLKETTRGGSDAAARQHIRSGLVVVQVALAMVLLIGAGLMINSFLRMRNNPLGGRTGGLLTFELSFSQNEAIKLVGRFRGSGLWNVNPMLEQTYTRVLERMRVLPGAKMVAAAAIRPYSGSFGTGFLKEGQSQAEQPVQGQNTSYNAITTQYFKALDVPMVQGRDFTEQDIASAPMVAIVNESMARKYWPEGAVGKTMKLDIVPGDPPRQIVGVVKDIRLGQWEREMRPAVYIPYRQQTEAWPGPPWNVRARMAYIIRTDGKPEALVTAMRNALSELEPNRAALEVATVEQYLAEQVEYDRLYMSLLVIFGGIAVVLAAIGIYGVMAYAVAERTREIGIRMSLGASQGTVFALVARRAAILIGAGVVLGIGGAYALTRLLADQLFEVTPTDPPTYAAVSALLALVAAAACVVPTRRAVSVDPTVALRYE